MLKSQKLNANSGNKISHKGHIREIKVKSLFGLFDYKISLSECGVTILIGANGSGKTTLFKMLNSILEGKFHNIINVKFEEFQILFDNGDSIVCRKEIESKKEYISSYGCENTEINIRYVNEFGDLWDKSQVLSSFEFIVDVNDVDIDHQFIELIEDPSSEKMDYKFIPLSDKELNFYRKLGLSTRFIETQRLQLSSYDENEDFSREKIRRRYIDGSGHKINDIIEKNISNSKKRIEEYAEDLSTIIKQNRSNYFAQSQDIEKRTLTEYLDAGPVDIEKSLFEDGKDLENTTLKIRKHMDKLLHLGIYESHELSRIGDLSLLDKKLEPLQKAKNTLMNDPSRHNLDKILDISLKSSLLKSYADNMVKKLNIFEELENKIELFRNNINSLFINKKMEIDLEEGFIFRLNKGIEKGSLIDSKELSSGEQHEVILNYELIFKTERNSIILIDEPEISLHILWQKKFVDNLLDIAKENNLNIIVATHSPDIVDNHRNLVHVLNDMGINEG